MLKKTPLIIFPLPAYYLRPSSVSSNSRGEKRYFLDTVPQIKIQVIVQEFKKISLAFLQGRDMICGHVENIYKALGYLEGGLTEKYWNGMQSAKMTLRNQTSTN